MKRILIVEDDHELRQSRATFFGANGFEVFTAKNGREGVAQFLAHQPDIVLLDVEMPGMDGFEACAQMRHKDPLVPIIFNTVRGSSNDKMHGYACGGDDYTGKDLLDSELLVKINAILRRLAAYRAKSEEAEVFKLGLLEIDLRSASASGGGIEVKLTKTECDLLRLLNTSRDRIFTYQEIFSALYGEGYYGDLRTLRSHFSHLKAKLGLAGRLLVNERGVGYLMMR